MKTNDQGFRLIVDLLTAEIRYYTKCVCYSYVLLSTLLGFSKQNDPEFNRFLANGWF